jgi:hypothetical protein
VVAKIQTGVRLCRRCGAEIAASRRSHAQYCTDLCGTLYRNKIWQAANPEKMKAAIRSWQQSNPERMAETNRRSRMKIPGAWAARQREWRRANPEKWNEMVALRRAAQEQAVPGWLTREDRRAMRVFYAEAQKLSKETGVPHHVDHIVPLRGKTVRGLHVPWNLQVIPALDNIRKRNRHHV